MELSLKYILACLRPKCESPYKNVVDTTKRTLEKQEILNEI